MYGIKLINYTQSKNWNWSYFPNFLQNIAEAKVSW
ncbi:MAG: hypothetical protein RIQ89_1850, partial [Bacteroidota bacterium]